MLLDSKQIDGKERETVTCFAPLSEETYKQMWMLRYQQYLGNISFLELLDKYEEMLGIPPQSPPG